MMRKRDIDTPAGDAGRYAYDGLDRVIHEKARLGILASLAAHADGLVFNDLKALCALTDGNLNRHLAVLGDAGFVEAHKVDDGPRTQTAYRLTREGRRRFVAYIDVLEGVVADAQADAQGRARPHAPKKAGWSPA